MLGYVARNRFLDGGQFLESAANGLLCGMADFSDPTTKDKADRKPR